MPSGEGQISIAWSIILWCGLFGLCSGVTYQLSAVPEKVALGQPLTIIAELINPTRANTDLRIILTQPGKQTVSFFHYRTATGCMFLIEPYISTGTVVACEPANSRYVIRFQSVAADHVGQYELQAPFENPARSFDAGETANVQLLVAPTSVIVFPSRREVVEGQSTNFLCSVDDQATLPVSFVWKRVVNGNHVNIPAASTTTMMTGGRGNRLSWNSVSRQHAGQYECRASNEVGQFTSQPATLVVYYPATSVTLSTSAGTTTVSVGTRVTFTCTSTGGNPRPGLVISDATSGRVLKESVQSSSTTLIYGPLSMQKSSNGAKYRCKTEVNVGAGTVPARQSNPLTMNVQFPPDDIKAPASVTVDEGQSTTIRCETTTSSNPKTELTWIGPAVGQSRTSESLGAHGGMHTGRFVTLTGDRTRNGATYICTATHLGQQIYTKSTKLDVNFAPNAIAFYDTLDTPIQENQERVLRCRTETSKPPGTVIWRRIHNGIQSIIPSESSTEVTGDFGGIILKTSIEIQPSRQDNGAKYWCEVEYTYTNGTEVIRRAWAKVLDVYYPVDVGIAVSQGTDHIREGDPITLTCATSGGNPQTIDKYTWTHNGNVVSGNTERILSLNPIGYDQGGKYSCSATNRGGTSTTSVDIDVRFKPRLDPYVLEKFEVEAQVGESVDLTLTIIANPAPMSIKWTDADDRTFSSSRYSESNDENIYSLNIKDLTEQDYSIYRCWVTNSVGLSNFQFTIIRKKVPPETPSNFTVTGRSSSTISLQWKHGSGGSTSGQIFLLEVIKGRNQIVKKHEVSDTNKTMVTFTVENLEPGTEYRFKLRAKNDVNLLSGFTQISSITKADISNLIITITRLHKTTVVVDWSTQDHLFIDYSNATVEVHLIALEIKQSEVGFKELSKKARSAKFSDNKLIINVLEGLAYVYNITVFDGDGIVFETNNQRAEKPGTGSPLVTIAIASASAAFACCLILAAIVITVVCCRRNQGSSTAPPNPTTSNQSSTGSNNRAYEDENPYMEPVHHSPEEECQYSEPGEANPYFYCHGNKYATVGEVSRTRKTNQSSDVRVSDNNATIASDVIAPPNDYIDMTSQSRAAKARVEEIERSLGVSAGGELRPPSDFRSSLRPDSESEYVQMNRPQSAVAEKTSETLT